VPLQIWQNRCPQFSQTTVSLRVRFPHLQHFNELIFAFAVARSSWNGDAICIHQNTGFVAEASMNQLLRIGDGNLPVRFLTLGWNFGAVFIAQQIAHSVPKCAGRNGLYETDFVETGRFLAGDFSISSNGIPSGNAQRSYKFHWNLML
jgi:hypothetical protein